MKKRKIAALSLAAILLAGAAAVQGHFAFQFHDLDGTLIYSVRPDLSGDYRDSFVTLSNLKSGTAVRHDTPGISGICYDRSRPGYLIVTDGKSVRSIPEDVSGDAYTCFLTEGKQLYPPTTAPVRASGTSYSSASVHSEKTETVVAVGPDRPETTILYPRISPSGDKLCFIRNSSLYYYQIGGEEHYILPIERSEDNPISIDTESIDWIDDNTIAYACSEFSNPEDETSITSRVMQVQLDTGTHSTLVEQGVFSSLSANGAYLAYRDAQENSTAWVLELKTGKARKCSMPHINLSKMKPSSDGTYLVYEGGIILSQGDGFISESGSVFEAMHIDSGRRKKLEGTVSYGMIDWNA